MEGKNDLKKMNKVLIATTRRTLCITVYPLKNIAQQSHNQNWNIPNHAQSTVLVTNLSLFDAML
jgi:hypothetical protein